MRAAHLARLEARTKMFSIARFYDLEESLHDFMDARGLDEWEVHFTRHLEVFTPAQLQAITEEDMKKLGAAAVMDLSRSTIQQVLKAIASTPMGRPKLSARRKQPALHLEYCSADLRFSDPIDYHLKL